MNDLSRRWTLPLATALACAVGLFAGLQLFGDRLVSRTDHAASRAAEVEQIWGGPLVQPQPEASWRRADAATPELTPAEITSTQVQVELDVEYRRRGITEYPGYRAHVAGNYRVANPVGDPIHAAFSVGLPSARTSLMLTDLSLTIDGKEDPAHTQYTPDRIIWTGRIGGGQTAHFALSYRARGLGRFGYALAPEESAQEEARPISHFELAMVVRGAHDEVDFPLGSMAPTLVETAPDGSRRMVWSVDRMLSAFDVGLVLPDKAGVASALGKLVRNAPWFYLLYAFSILWVMGARTPREKSLHLVGFSGAYFLYFPLATYLVAYLPWPVAAAVGTIAIGALAILHARRFLGATAAVGVAACQSLFLAVPAAAYLIPAHTGIILVLAGFVALALALRQVGTLAERAAPDLQAVATT